MMSPRFLSAWFGMRTKSAATSKLLSEAGVGRVVPLELTSPPATDESDDALHADYHARMHGWST